MISRIHWPIEWQNEVYITTKTLVECTYPFELSPNAVSYIPCLGKGRMRGRHHCINCREPLCIFHMHLCIELRCYYVVGIITFYTVMLFSLFVMTRLINSLCYCVTVLLWYEEDRHTQLVMHSLPHRPCFLHDTVTVVILDTKSNIIILWYFMNSVSGVIEPVLPGRMTTE